MGVDDFKLYSAKVGEGSGVLFQPMNELDYTYILTAKHNIFGERDTLRGIKEKYLLDTISIIILNGDKPLPFEVIKGENYFPHKEADIAILKIAYVEGFDNIFKNTNYENLSKSFLCGYPEFMDTPNSTLSEQYTSYQLERYIDNTNYFHKAQLTSETKEYSEITGMSGGGIMKIENDVISLFGIQSEMSSNKANGQIEFIPIKYFDEIISYPENSDLLSPLLPPHIGSFKFLKNEIIKITGIDPNFKDKIKSAVQHQMELFLKSDPYSIYKSKIGSKLLGDNSSNPFSKELWISWLEFLTILCFLKNEEIDIDTIENIFNSKRLLHTDSKQEWIEIVSNIVTDNLEGIEDNATLIISTKKAPLSRRRFKNEIIQNIVTPRLIDKQEPLRIDQGESIKSLKEVMHIKAISIDCIENSENSINDISALDVQNIINELTNKLNEFFED